MCSIMSSKGQRPVGVFQEDDGLLRCLECNGLVSLVAHHVPAKALDRSRRVEAACTS